MRVTAEALVELGHLLVDHGVVLDDVNEFHLLLHVRQIAVLEQIGDIKEVAVFGEFLDRITAIEKFTLVTVDIGDRRLARSRRQEARVVGEKAGFRRQGTDVDAVVAMHRREDRKLHRILAVNNQFCLALSCHCYLPKIMMSMNGSWQKMVRALTVPLLRASVAAPQPAGEWPPVFCR